jgi:serine/threonine-protein kinase
MPMPSPHQWLELSPYLDEALAMSDQERARWLNGLRAESPAVADQIAVLFEDHQALAEQGFLEKQSVPLPATLGLTGRALGTYTLLSQIGQGGMGSVWLAKRNDGRFQRQVAIKFLNIALLGKSGEERFKREGNFLAKLAHPHIAQLLDAGISDAGQPYLVLENVEGMHIDQYCDERKLGVEARVRLFIDVLRAVAHAHANLLVHRDLKPSNVLVRKDGQVKLLDFGIAKLLEDEKGAGEATQLTVDGGRALTPECAAPEQLRGEPVTTATDVYALGVLLYVLLTGQHPAGPGPHAAADLVKAIVETESARPSDVVASSQASAQVTTISASMRATTPEKLHRLLRGDLDTIVTKALKKDPLERYSSVAAMSDDLRRYLRNEPIGARPDTLAYRTAKFVRRHRPTVALALLAAVATVAGLVGTVLQTRTARAQRDFAFRQLLRSQEHDSLLEFLLSDAAPSGKPFTANDLLTRAESIVQRQHSIDPARRADLMIWIGGDYLAQDQSASARRVLEQAYKDTRSLPDPALRAAAACGLADVLSQDIDLPRAELLFREGLRELTRDPRFANTRVDCLRTGGDIAVQRGEASQGLSSMLEARQVLRESPFVTEEREMRASLDVAEAYSQAGRDTESLSEFERAANLLSSLGRDQTETAVVLFTGWGLALDQVGRPLEAEKIYRRVIEINRDNRSVDAVFPSVLLDYSKTLRQLNRLAEASDYADRACDRAKHDGHELTVNQALLERARIYLAQHKLARASEMLAEVEPRLRKTLPPSHYAFAALASEQAMTNLEKGDLTTAFGQINQAVAIVEAAIQSGGNGSFYLPGLLTRRSTIELSAGMTDQALADASRAIHVQATAQPGAFSSKSGYAYLALGRALQSQGKAEEARAAFHSAAENLRSTVGENHPDTRMAQQGSQI